MRCQIKHLWNTIKERWRKFNIFCKFHEVGCTVTAVCVIIILAIILTLVYAR